MAEPEHRSPLGQIPIVDDSNIIINQAPVADQNVVTKPHHPDDSNVVPLSSADPVNDLASSMANNLRIIDEDDDFDEGKGSMQTVDWKKENREMDKMFEAQSAQQLKDLPPFVAPRGFRKTVEFYDHQKDGISWLVHQERDAPPNPFVRSRTLKSGEVAQYDRLTRGRLSAPHPPVKGSILADDMGLGKTLQTLGLILSNPPEGYTFSGDGDEIEAPICTLIVAPKTVLANWISQSKQFVKSRKLETVLYTGTPKQRSKIIQQVEENEIDVLLSSYETIMAEHEKDRKGLLGVHDVAFHRIVLDEAQQIRNPKSKCFKAIMAVAAEAEYRLALTGTPFVNKPEDIASLLTFVGLQPLSDAATFKTFISDPIKERKRAGLTRLRASLAYVALRRTKNTTKSVEAEKTINIVSVEFPDGVHKDIHDVLYLAAQAAFEASINGGGKEYTESEAVTGVTANAQQAMFSLLMRVRQSCDSGNLVAACHYQVASECLESMKDENGNIIKLTAKDGNKMIDHLQNANNEDDSRLRVEGDSPKIKALLTEIGKMDAAEKGVIFSQWTAMLDLIEVALTNAGHTFTRIDGSMSTEQRAKALEDLTNDDNTRFILCSLKAAGVGINLTRANVAYMMDPWWNAAMENQAIDRVHRMGQTRDVRVYRFVMKDTIEERMLNVQKAKSALGKGTMQKLSAAEERVAKLTGLKDLFQIKEDNDDIDGFIDKSDEWF